MPTHLDTLYFATKADATQYLVDNGWCFWRTTDDEGGVIYRDGLGFALVFKDKTVNGGTCWAVDIPRKYH